METQPLSPSFNTVAGPVVSFERALELFDELADMGDIAFGYTGDGCYARAHIMCVRLMDMGLQPQKAWAFENEKGQPLTVIMADKKTEWWFHVAPTLAVQMPDQTIQNMVLDPSLFDGPVSLGEWGKIMQAEPDNLQVARFGVPPRGYATDYIPRPGCGEKTTSATDMAAKDCMQKYLGLQTSGIRMVFPSQIRQQAAQAQPVQQQKQGKTWVTMNLGVIQGGQAMQALPPLGV